MLYDKKNSSVVLPMTYEN